jgi:hypothetical protein
MASKQLGASAPGSSACKTRRSRWLQLSSTWQLSGLRLSARHILLCMGLTGIRASEHGGHDSAVATNKLTWAGSPHAQWTR